MSDADIKPLIAAATAVSLRSMAGDTPAEILAHLVAEHGGKLNATGNTNTFRCAGIGGSCTWSADSGLLSSWLGNATKRIRATGHTPPGHNSQREAAATDDRLRLLIERVERLEEEKKGIVDDIRDVFAEATAVGYDAKIMRQIVKLRKMKPDDRAEMEALLDTYKCAVGLA